MKNHQIVNGKLLQMNKKFNQIKERQRIKIAEWLYEAYKKLRVEENRVLNREEDTQIIEDVMEKISNAEIWISKREVFMYYEGKKTIFSKRFDAENKV